MESSVRVSAMPSIGNAHSQNVFCSGVVGMSELYASLLRTDPITAVVLSHSRHSDFLQTLLCDQEESRAARLLRTEDACTFRVAHGLKRLVCSTYIGSAPEQLVFSTDIQGKPFLVNRSKQLWFNLSHSGIWAGVGVSREGALGLDVQNLVDMTTFPFTEVIHPQDVLKPATAIMTTRIWAIKEAAVKADGIGLVYGLDNIVIKSCEHMNWF